MAHKRSIRLQCMMSFPTVSLLLFRPSFLFQSICSDSIRAPWHFVDARAYTITAVIESPHKGALHTRNIGFTERFDAGQLLRVRQGSSST